MLPEFLGLLLLLMAVTRIAAGAHPLWGITSFTDCVVNLSNWILDTHVERIEQLGSASLLAGLTSDVAQYHHCFCASSGTGYRGSFSLSVPRRLWMLSGKMLLVTAIWMAITIWGGFVLVARVYKHMATLRETEDKLYTDFQTVLEGRKELTLNRERAGMCSP